MFRNFFPEQCFDEQAFDVSNDQLTYADFASGNISTQDDQTRQKFPLLRKGRHSGVDTVLDMLEKGAFDALQRKWLRALQITVIEDPAHPEEVIESWTFNFEYAQLEQDGKSAISVRIGNQPPQSPITVAHAKQALQKLLRPVPTFCNTLPDLPGSYFTALPAGPHYAHTIFRHTVSEHAIVLHQ